MSKNINHQPYYIMKPLSIKKKMHGHFNTLKKYWQREKLLLKWH